MYGTMESQAAVSRQTMRALPTDPLEILLYALGEVEQTVWHDDEFPSLVGVRNILNGGITLLRAGAA
ncbi:MAG: hypothetical protein P4K78_04740 [Terracidiphilus sp.]|nr:hypothetical protein [Terracidiphilus sp.]